MSALYPRTKIKAPENSSLNRDKLVDIVAMLLLAGATLEVFCCKKLKEIFRAFHGIKVSKVSQKTSRHPLYTLLLMFSKLVAYSILKYIIQARKKKSFERSFRFIEDAYNEVFTYFEIPRVRTEE